MPATIVGIIGGDPFDRRTWSGASHHLFTALRDHGALEGAVSALPPEPVELAAKAAAVWPRRRRWVERYEYSPARRVARGVVGARRAAAIDPSPDALLQVGAYFDFSRSRALRPRLRCSFHDSNLALFSREHRGIEDPDAPHIRREWRSERRVFDRLDLIMTMSDWLRASFLEDFGQAPDKVVTVGSGVNAPRLPGPPPQRDWSVPRLLFVGLEWERKGGPELLAAFRRLRAAAPAAELSIVGAERPADAADEPGVRWHGRIDRSDPAGDAAFERLHHQATLFVLPSRYDPMPNAMLEAMAHGLPCVGTRVCAVPEIVEHGTTGRLVAPEDPAALHAAIAELAADPERSRRFGAAGRDRVLERFTWDTVARRMVAAIDERLR